MQNEILKPVLDTDEVAVPRYDIVGPNGSVIQQNVELRLKNEVVQEGTPYDEESVLPASLREQLELPQSATPAEAMAALLTKGGGAVRRNRPPLTTDAEQVGKLWVVPEMFFNNLMPNALTQVASNWQSSNAAVAVSGNTATFTGNGTENSVYVQAGMLASAKAGDKIFVQATVQINHDANAATIQLTCGEQILATKTLDVPAAGDTMLLQAVAIVEASGALVLRVHSAYNTATVQSGKGMTVSAITVWNLTEDMCEAQEGNEFTEQEAVNYISSFGQFQTKEYEYSTWWWVLRGVTNGSYLWHRMFDEATLAEAQAGIVDDKWMTPAKVSAWAAKNVTPTLTSTVEALLNNAVSEALVFAARSYAETATGRERNVGYKPGSALATSGNAQAVGEAVGIGLLPYNSSMSASQKAANWDGNFNNQSGSPYPGRCYGIGFKCVQSGLSVSFSAIRMTEHGYGGTDIAFNSLSGAIVRYNSAGNVTAVLQQVALTNVSVTGPSGGGWSTTGSTITFSDLTYTTTSEDVGNYIGLVVYGCSKYASNNSRRVGIPVNKNNPSQGIGSFEKLDASISVTNMTYTLQNVFELGTAIKFTRTQGIASGKFPAMTMSITGGSPTGVVTASMPNLNDRCSIEAVVVEANKACTPKLYIAGTQVTGEVSTETGLSANGTSCTRSILRVKKSADKASTVKVEVSSSSEMTVYDVCTKAM